MKICILGGGSPFALNTARHLLRMGHEVIGLGRSPLKGPAFDFGIEREGYRYTTLHIVYELDCVIKFLDTETPSVIINYAAQGENSASFNPMDNWRFYQTNVLALARLVGHLQRRNWLQRFIHIGTSELYGSVSKPAKETDALNPTSPYGISKAAFDQHLICVFNTHQFPMNIIRPCNGYCPGQQLYRIIPKTIIAALKGAKLPLHGGGYAEKSYLHGNDISKAIELVMNQASLGKVYNCGALSYINIKSLVLMCAEACGKQFEDICDLAPERLGQDQRYWLDSTELAKDTGWTQTIGIRNGIDEMVQWIKSYPELLKMDSFYRLRS